MVKVTPTKAKAPSTPSMLNSAGTPGKSSPPVKSPDHKKPRCDDDGNLWIDFQGQTFRLTQAPPFPTAGVVSLLSFSIP